MVFDVTTLTAEMELLIIVYWSCNEYIENTFPIIFQGPVNCQETSVSRFLGRHAQLHFYFLIEHRNEVNPTVLYLLHVVDDGEVCWNIQGIAVVCGHLRRTIDNGSAEFEHLLFSKGFKNQFISYSVCIAMSNGNTDFSVFTHTLSYIYIILIYSILFALSSSVPIR